jgi:outer membrane protein assembly factor BamA
VAQGSESGHLAPPDVFGGAVAGTENGTRFAGAGGMFSFRDDRWRYRGGVGWTDARLDFYGVGGSLPGGARKIAYELEGLFSTQQALLRLGDSRHFLGLRWVWLDFASLLAEEEGEPDDAELEFESRGSALGPSWEFDSRDNIFTPSRGLVAALDSLFYREEVGSDRDFETYRGYVFAYLPLGKPFVLGLRADARAARGDVPFYQLPFIDLRGVPLGRYQDENAGVLEAELRWTFADRWGLVLFAGDGRAWGAREAFDEAEDQVAGGVGIRYEIARRLGLWAGLDVARGPEEEAFYLQVGSGWR